MKSTTIFSNLKGKQRWNRISVVQDLTEKKDLRKKKNHKTTRSKKKKVRKRIKRDLKLPKEKLNFPLRRQEIEKLEKKKK